MSFVFQVWNCSRERKAAIAVPDNNDALKNIIKKGSGKLQIKGKIIVLEGSGTPIDDVELLKYFKQERLTLLRTGESLTSDSHSTSSVYSNCVSPKYLSTTPSTHNEAMEIMMDPNED